MIRFFLPSLLLLWSPLQAQTRPVACKLVCFAKVPNAPEILYTKTGKDGEFTPAPLSLSINTKPVDLFVGENGKISFLNGQAEDSAVVATATIPRNVKEAYLFMIPVAPGGTELFNVVILPQSEKTTPVGGAYFCNIAPSKVRMSVGEHKYELLPGKVVSIPQPAQRDKYNMVEMSLMMERENEWVSMKDNMTRFSSRDRYFVFTYLHPRYKRPMVKIYKQSVPVPTVVPGAGA